MLSNIPMLCSVPEQPHFIYNNNDIDNDDVNSNTNSDDDNSNSASNNTCNMLRHHATTRWITMTHQKVEFVEVTVDKTSHWMKMSHNNWPEFADVKVHKTSYWMQMCHNAHQKVEIVEVPPDADESQRLTRRLNSLKSQWTRPSSARRAIMPMHCR